MGGGYTAAGASATLDLWRIATTPATPWRRQRPGILRLEVAPRQTKLAVADRTLLISERFATLVEHHKKRTEKDRRTSIELAGRLVIARDVRARTSGSGSRSSPHPREGMRRIFASSP